MFYTDSEIRKIACALYMALPKKLIEVTDSERAGIETTTQCLVRKLGHLQNTGKIPPTIIGSMTMFDEAKLAMTLDEFNKLDAHLLDIIAIHIEPESINYFTGGLTLKTKRELVDYALNNKLIDTVSEYIDIDADKAKKFYSKVEQFLIQSIDDMLI